MAVYLIKLQKQKYKEFYPQPNTHVSFFNLNMRHIRFTRVKYLVTLGGFEPPTCHLGEQCSI